MGPEVPFGSVRPVRTRLATNDDAEAIRVIYNAEVVGSTVTFDMVPRSPSDQLAWLVEHGGAHPAIVAVGENEGGEDAGQSGDSGGVLPRGGAPCRNRTDDTSLTMAVLCRLS